MLEKGSDSPTPQPKPKSKPAYKPDANLDVSRVSQAPSPSGGTSTRSKAPQSVYALGTSTSFDDEQLQNAAVIAQVGQELGASPWDIQVAIMAALVESGLRNLDYGDRDSIGMFQQRDAWGSRNSRLDPYQSARMFFVGGAAGQRGLLDFGERRSMSMGQAAQAVQVSAFPERYAERQAEAAQIMVDLDGVRAPKQGTLGAVPGLEEDPTSIPMQAAPTTREVNGVGDITADETGIGALSFEEGASALDGLTFDGSTLDAIMGAATSDGSRTGGTGGGGAPSTPGGGTSMSYPGGSTGASYDSSGIIVPSQPSVPSGPGTTYAGSYKGRDPYELTTYDGATVDFLTHAALTAAKEEFGADFRLMQGSHNAGGVAASGGTHDGGGVIDLAPSNGDWDGAVESLRKMGFAAWVRNVPGHGYAGSGAHIHAVLMGNERLSPQAQVQVNSYLNNDDGLAGSRADDSTRAYVNNRFVWGDALAAEGRRERDEVVSRAAGLLGTPFAWGGEDYAGLDQMGFAKKVFNGLSPTAKTVSDLVAVTEPGEIEHAEIGDLVAWKRGQEMGIYVGDGLIITPGSPGQAVQVIDAEEIGDVWSIPMTMLTRDPFEAQDPFTPPKREPTLPAYTTKLAGDSYSPSPVSKPSYSPPSTPSYSSPSTHGSKLQGDSYSPSGSGGKSKSGGSKPSDAHITKLKGDEW